MSGSQVGKTTVQINAITALPPDRTYVCIGLERGGTSAVAGVMRGLGVPIGDAAAGLDGNNEDPSFHAKGLGEMRQTIRERNETYPVWGWKYPTAARYLPALIKDLRNPHFIVVYRDAVATALGRKKWDGDFLDRDARLSLHEASVATEANTSFALATGAPCLMVSYEKAMADKAALVAELAEFLGQEVPAGAAMSNFVDYLEPGSYKRFEDYFTRGRLPSLRRTFGVDSP